MLVVVNTDGSESRMLCPFVNIWLFRSMAAHFASMPKCNEHGWGPAASVPGVCFCLYLLRGGVLDHPSERSVPTFAQFEASTRAGVLVPIAQVLEEGGGESSGDGGGCSISEHEWVLQTWCAFATLCLDHSTQCNVRQNR